MTDENKQIVWMIIPTFYPVVGGTQSQVLRLTKRLLSLGWDVRVITRQHSFYHPQGLPAHEVVDGIQVQRIFSRGGKFGSLLFLLGGLVFLCRNGRGQIYHAHDIGAAGWLAVICARLFGGSSLIKLRTGRKWYEQYLDGHFSRWQLMALFRLVSQIIIVNREVEDLLAGLGISAKHMIYLPNAVDVNHFHLVTDEIKFSLRRQFNIPLHSSVVCYVGRLSYLKGVDILLNSWAQLPAEIRCHTILALVGDGEERPVLEELIARLALKDSVILYGMQENVRDYYWASDVFILPSRQEGLSNSMIEAMSCGLPVISSATGGALDIVADGQNGWLFRNDQPEHLCQILMRCLDERNLWQGMGEVSRHTIIQLADVVSMDEKIQGIYYRLARSPIECAGRAS